MNRSCVLRGSSDRTQAKQRGWYPSRGKHPSRRMHSNRHWRSSGRTAPGAIDESLNADQRIRPAERARPIDSPDRERKGGLSMLVPITAIYAVILGVINIALEMPVGMMRGRTKIPIHDDGNLELRLKIRKHDNFTEHVPFVLILLALLELNGGAPGLLSRTWHRARHRAHRPPPRPEGGHHRVSPARSRRLRHATRNRGRHGGNRPEADLTLRLRRQRGTDAGVRRF